MRIGSVYYGVLQVHWAEQHFCGGHAIKVEYGEIAFRHEGMDRSRYRWVHECKEVGMFGIKPGQSQSVRCTELVHDPRKPIHAGLRGVRCFCPVVQQCSRRYVAGRNAPDGGSFGSTYYTGLDQGPTSLLDSTLPASS